jgi:hypothetical protein
VTGFLIVALVGLSTAGAYLVGLRLFRFSEEQLWPAVSRVLEGLGIGLAFYAINLLAGATLILAVRRLTGRFVSIYHVEDLSLLVLSLLQGLIFCAWREPPRNPSTRQPPV